MDRSNAAAFFRSSRRFGIAYQLSSYTVMLLCGYLVSALLELALEADWERMYPIAAWSVGVLSLSAGPLYLLSRARSRKTLEDTQRFREELYRATLRRKIQIRDSGELEVKLSSDTETVAAFFQNTYPEAVGGGIMLVVSTVLLCTVDMRVGLLFFCLNFMQLIPIFIYEHWARQIYNETHEAEADYQGWMLEGYNGISTIKSYGVEDWFLGRYNELSQSIIRFGKRAERTGTIETIIFETIDSFLNYGSYLILGVFVLYGGLDISRLPILIVLSNYLFSSISSIFTLRLQQFDYEEAVKRMAWADGGKSAAIPVSQALIEVRGAGKSFGEKEVLRDASCLIHTGEKLLLIGQNGSGKTTLLRLLLGLESPDSGAVAYSQTLSEDWDTQVSYALQEEGQLHVSANELMAALAGTGLMEMAEFAQHLSAFRLSGPLMEKDLEEMSSGERKKFYLAAALAKRGQLLVLDEPTNHLDRESVEHLLMTLRSFKGTLVVCSHESGLPLDWDQRILVKGGSCHAER